MSLLVSIPLMKLRTCRPVVLLTAFVKSPAEAYWKNIRISRSRWCSPIPCRLRSAGVKVFSSRQTTVSCPA